MRLRRFGPLLAGVVGVLALSRCAPAASPSAAPSPVLALDFPVDCGPIQVIALCQIAIDVAATAKINPPPIVRASIRRPRADDECLTAFHECGPTAVIVVIQSGDTLQEVPLIPTTSGGWVRLDLIR